MRYFFVFLSLLSLSSASAITTEALSLMTNGVRTDDDTFLFNTSGEQLTVVPVIFANIDMEVNRMDLRFQRKTFSSSDWPTVNRLVWNVAERCMNLNPQRRVPLLNWISAHNSLGKGKWLTTFGPMTVRFERFVDANGVAQSVIGLGRSEAPGTGHWQNYCEDNSAAG